VEIRDVAGQQALAGKTAAETIALLNRDTSDTLNSLNPIFDKEKIEAGFDIVEEAVKQMGQFFTNRAREADLAKARSEDPTLSESERLQAAKEYYDLKSKWGMGSDYRRLSTAILAAISGMSQAGLTSWSRLLPSNTSKPWVPHRSKSSARGWEEMARRPTRRFIPF